MRQLDPSGAADPLAALQRLLDARPGLADISGEHGQVAYGHHAVGAVAEFADAHGIADGGGGVFGVHAGRGLYVFGGHAGYLADALEVVLRQ